MGDVKDNRAAGHGRPALSVAMILIALALFAQIPLTGLIAAEPGPTNREETTSTPEGRMTAPSPEREGEKRQGDWRKEDDREPSGYPRSYIVPKGLCEGNEPVLEIRR